MLATNHVFHNVHYFKVLPPTELSDHSLICTSLKTIINNDRENYVNNNSKYSPVNGRFTWSDQCKYAYQTALVEEDSVNEILKLNELIEDSNFSDMNKINYKLTDIYTKAASKTLQFKAPLKKQLKIKRKHKPWMSNDLHSLKREVRRIGRKLQNDPKNCDLLQSYARAKRNFNKLKKTLKHEFFKGMADKIDNLNKENSRDFWKILKNNKTTANSSSNPPSIQTFVDHYKNLLCTKKDNSYELYEKSEIDKLQPLDFPFTCREVKSGIKNLKSGKSPGPDLILNEFIKNSSEILVPTLTKLFNKILNTGNIPEIWNLVQITSLYKSGDPKNPSNYRGLSVTSCMGKLFNGLLQNRLNSYLENKKLLSDNQFGFRKNHRTTDNIFILKTLINKYLKLKKQKLFACFIDFTKAFDSVDRTALLYKLYKKGVGGKFYSLIKSMYSLTKYSCKDKFHCSDPFLTNIGVKQGDNLSPTLFNIFVDDFHLQDQCTFPPELDNITVNHLFFADDLIILSTKKEGLQHCLDKISAYCAKWNLTVNLTKTNIMIFCNKKIDTSVYGFYYNNAILPQSHEYKYLGIIFTYNGQLKIAAEQLADRARKAYYSIKHSFTCSNYLSVKSLLKLYYSLIEPILLYGSEIWISDYNINILKSDNFPFEKIQHLIFKGYFRGS